ncbi:MAG: TetR/AcrR family transcriptional regulator [Pseudonocardiaceae bacterium]
MTIARSGTAAPVGRRQRKKVETRLALRAAATDLVRDHGLDHVTVEDITERADVSPRTFFNYFASKEDALTAVDIPWLAALRAGIRARPDTESPLVTLRLVLVEAAKDLAGQREAWLSQIEVIKSDPRLVVALAASWGAIEHEIGAAISGRVDGDDPIAAAAIAAAAVAVFRCAITRADGRRKLATVVQSAFDALAWPVEAPIR